jgi:two-component system, cell cycle response regulator
MGWTVADKGNVLSVLRPEAASAVLAPDSPVEVLVADDSPVSRRLLEVALCNWGYKVTTVSTGSAAWDVLQRPDAPRLAILDWMMPGLSGPEVCSLAREQQSRSNGSYTYIVLLTSRNEKEDLIAGMEAGADDYLIKPFDNNELKVRLRPGLRIVQLQSQLLEAQEALREQATRDALTKLWNRHAIWEILTREIARSQREGTPLGVVMGDLDHFKLVNDTFGHVAGDAVLREVSARMKGSIRTYDAAGRYGGEEFVLILPGCDEDSAAQTAERIRQSIGGAPILIDGTPVPVSASFGVTSLPKGLTADPESLIRVADAAMYHAKQAGRGRTVCLPFTG